MNDEFNYTGLPLLFNIPPKPLQQGDCHLLYALPRELRLRIYEELFHPAGGFHPQIRLVNAFAYEDTKETLQKFLKITLLTRIRLSWDAEPTGRDGPGELTRFRKALRLDREIFQFQPASQHFRHSHIDLTIVHTSCKGYPEYLEADYMLKARFKLYLLVTQILHSGNITHVHLHIRLQSDGDSRRDSLQRAQALTVKDLSLPIRQLLASEEDDPNPIALTVTGDLPHHLKTTLYDPLLSNTRSRSTLDFRGRTALWRWLQVRSEAQEHIDVLERAGDGYMAKALLHSVVGVLPRPAGCDDGTGDEHKYVDSEKDVNQRAVNALTALRTGQYARLKERAEARLAAASMAGSLG